MANLLWLLLGLAFVSWPVRLMLRHEQKRRPRVVVTMRHLGEVEAARTEIGAVR